MNLIFMGTPKFSVPSLSALLENGHTVSAVFTKPDKPKNRGHKLQMSPVKEFALEKGIMVFQPQSLKHGEDAEKTMELLRTIRPDCIIVVAYGQILPRDVLMYPDFGCINVHASLLPKYRGAAPIQRCIMDGEAESGVTTMFMADGIDTGDMLLKSKVQIAEKMTGSQLHDILKEEGARLLIQTLSRLEKGSISRIPQSDDGACYASMIDKETCRIDFSKPANTIYNQIRGLADSPCAFTFLDDKRMKVFFAEQLDGKYGKEAGTVVKGDGLCVVCGDGNALRFTDIQLEGSKRMSDNDMLRGRKTPIEKLG